MFAPPAGACKATAMENGLNVYDSLYELICIRLNAHEKLHVSINYIPLIKFSLLCKYSRAALK
jgi:hypothetical protein